MSLKSCVKLLLMGWIDSNRDISVVGLVSVNIGDVKNETSTDLHFDY